MRVAIVGVQNQVLDEIEFRASFNAGYTVTAKMRRIGDVLGRELAEYLQQRVSAH